MLPCTKMIKNGLYFNFFVSLCMLSPFTASFLIKGGYSVKMLDLRLESLSDFEIGKPLFVGISSIHASQIRYGLEFARRVRTLDPSIPLVWGWGASYSIA